MLLLWLLLRLLLLHGRLHLQLCQRGLLQHLHLSLQLNQLQQLLISLLLLLHGRLLLL
jgi:hypothetical protein